MASSGNFATIGIFKLNSGVSYQDGRTSFTTGNNTGVMCGTNCIPGHKWYFEFRCNNFGGNNVSGDQFFIGVAKSETQNNLTQARGGGDGDFGAYVVNSYTGNVRLSSGSSGGATGTGAFAQNTVIGVAVDRVNNTIKFNKDGGSFGTAYTIPSDIDLFPFVGGGGGSNCQGSFNFGADSTFGGRETVATNSDDNSIGEFHGAVPSGYLALSSFNLPISDDIDPAQTDDNYPSKQFGVVTYTGNSSTNAVTGLNLQPDLLWVKKTTATGTNYLSDTSRGINKFLFSNGNDAEQTGGGYASIYSAFGTDGFTLGSSATGPNDSGATYVAWGWRANGGTTTTDTSGDISTVRQSNTASGFAILTWSGNGSNNQRLPHGLGKKPAFVIAKRRDSAQSWGVWTQSLGANSKEMQFDNSGEQNSSNAWYQSGMTTDFVGIGSDRNISSSTNVAYVWADVEGMQKFGGYTGNGNSDGPFVYTGFRPRMIFMKWAAGGGASAEPWGVFDTARATYNPTSAHSDGQVYWNSSEAASAGSTHGVDFLSNGFKLRGNGGLNNFNGASYIYGAWGDVSYKYNNTF